ncbi:PREDICTED: putative small intestine sodium-dependent phosphate transport protein-like [Chrysochloris asiatica]|uniref:Small intestine sodium-dependent phosphate transport protein-like n=1 Tax=Chrysochloris asiatica TaxID=185453 RepID=A0A9B0TYZ0_CHRAS|nr:PREDICTED: putative small intestine sodium-dependent phosphate transport protein-like [Chrysochloris asiatica]
MSTVAEARATEADISNKDPSIVIPFTVFSGENLDTSQVQNSRKGFCSNRHGLAFILMLCNFATGTQKITLSIVIQAMVNHTTPPNHSNASTEMSFTDSQDYWNETLKEFKELAPVYDWSPEIQGIILSSLNYGSFLVPLPAGYVAGKFGVKRVVGAGLFISSIMILLTPPAADIGVTLFIVIQVVQGIAQVMVTTGQFPIWVKWAPPVERSQLTSIASSGLLLGPLIGFAVGGLLCQALGWPYVFYIFGAVGSVCCLLWFFLISDDPMHHPFISSGEKEYILCALAQQDCSPAQSLPLRAMFKSLPVWAILISHFCQSWSFQIILTYTPTFISSVLQTDLTISGLLSSLPSVFAFIFMILGSLLADFLLSRKLLRLITVRKLFTAIGVIFPSLIVVSLYWVRSSASTFMIFLVLFYALSSLCYSGAFVNSLDIAPRHAGFLKGLSQIFLLTAGAISPTTAGFFISQDSEVGWRNVFLLSAAINILGLMFYLLFAKADVQDWAERQTVTHF